MPEVMTPHSGHRDRTSTSALVSSATPDHHQRSSSVQTEHRSHGTVRRDLTMVDMANITHPRDNIFFTPPIMTWIPSHIAIEGKEPQTGFVEARHRHFPLHEQGQNQTEHQTDR